MAPTNVYPTRWTSKLQGTADQARAELPLETRAEDVRRQLYASVDLWSSSMHEVIKCGTGQPRYRLGYMPMRNRCEVARLVLEEAGCPYEFEVIGFKVWGQVKPQTPLGKVPVLYDFDGAGNILSQENAITRFVARKLGLAGQTESEQALVDMLYEQYWCTFRNNGISHEGEHYSIEALKGLERRGGPRYQEMRRVNNFTRGERSLAALGVFEERLESSETGFLVGDTPTVIDLALFEALFELAEADNIPDFATRFDFPKLGAFLATMEARPRVRAYLESPRRMRRYSRPGYVYKPGKDSPRPSKV
jgi:glutathione S-transferase